MIRSRFIADVGRLASGTFVGQVILLAISPLLTRLYTPVDFGVFSLVVAASALIVVFATLRLETIIPAVRRTFDALRLMQVMLLLSFVTAGVTLAAVMTFRPQLEVLLSIPAGGGAALYLLPMLIIAFAVYSGVRALCIRRARFAAIGRAQVARALCMAVAWIGLGFAGLLKTPGLALAAGQAAGDLLFSGELARALGRRELQVLMTPSWRRIRAALSLNARTVKALVSSQAIAALYSRLPLVVIAGAYGPAQAGFYALAERVMAAPPALISRAIGDVYRQRAADVYRGGQPIDSLMRKVLGLTLALSIVPFGAAMLLVPSYTGVVLGEEWQPAAFTITILLFSSLVSFNTTPLDNTAIIVGANRYIVSWHALRLAIEGGAAVAAVSGILDYEAFLVTCVVGRMFAYLLDLAMMISFARGRVPF